MIDPVPRETRARLADLVELVVDENRRQNLVSASTVLAFETRHVEDSLQLLPLLPDEGVVVDIGSGGGFPGLVLACARGNPMHLVEPRARRAEFLERARSILRLHHVTVHASKIERVTDISAGAITARAVASLDALFAMAAHIASTETRWVLPKGRSAQSELDAARQTWQGEFELVPSRTDPEAAIVVAHRVRRRDRA